MNAIIDQQISTDVGIEQLLTTNDETNDTHTNKRRPSQLLISDNNSTTRSIKDVFNLSKIYFKYLLTIKTKIINNNIVINDKMKEFNEYYDNATIIYDIIKKEWFWITNGEKMSQFILNSESLDNHRANFFDNHSMLEFIAKMYGFDTWIAKNRLSTTPNDKRKQRSTIHDDIAQS